MYMWGEAEDGWAEREVQQEEIALILVVVYNKIEIKRSSSTATVHLLPGSARRVALLCSCLCSYGGVNWCGSPAAALISSSR